MDIEHPKGYKRKYFEQMINEAISFLNQYERFDIQNLKIKFIVTIEYQQEVNKYHLKPENSTSNAMYIPTFYQRGASDSSVIIVNWHKIRNAPESFKKSVFVHEITHYFDYLLCSTIEDKYGKIFMINVVRNSFADVIGAYFQMRSEMRAKYYQEKYECSVLNNKPELVIDRCRNNATKIPPGDDNFYEIAHLTGQYLCWKKILNNDVNLLNVENTLKGLWHSNPCSDYRQMFKVDEMWLKLDAVSNKFNQSKD